MPIYEYRCECGNEGEVTRSFQEYDQPQTCVCGKVMQRKVSVFSSVMKQTGKGMALETLNSKDKGMPDRSWTQQAAIAASAGLERPPKTVW